MLETFGQRYGDARGVKCTVLRAVRSEWVGYVVSNNRGEKVMHDE